MTNDRVVKIAAPWRSTAAYLYTLDLDDPALAWEYLRRRADYLQEWRASRRRVDAQRWGLRKRRKSSAGCAGRPPAVGDRRGRLAAFTCGSPATQTAR